MSEKNKKNFIPQKPKMGFNQYWIFAILGLVFLGLILQSKSDQENISVNKFKEIALRGDIDRIDVINKQYAEITLREEALSKPEYQELGLIERIRLHKQIKLLTENKYNLFSNF